MSERNVEIVKGAMKAMKRTDERTVYSDLGETVLVLASGRIEGLGGSARTEHGWIWRFEDGRIRSVRSYPTYDDAFRALGV